MKIAYITAGAAQMYCGSCMRDNTLAAALIATGHECLLIPTYTPIRTDEDDVSIGRVFFGGINVYLEQKASLFRRLPRFFDRLLSMPRLLRWVSGFAIDVQPEPLAELTISMLKGTEGFQRREVLKLVDWLANEVRPAIVVLTNALISGLVPELKRRLRVPVLCTLQGDDIFLEFLPADLKRQALALIQENCRQIDGYLTTSRYYADFMAGYLGIPREHMHVVHPGINLKGYSEEPPRPRVATGAAPTIGYLARICPEKGLHVLVDAFEILRGMPGFAESRLRVAGYLGARDRQYLQDLRKRVEQQGWADRFEYAGELDHQGKLDFLRTLDIFSVPTTYREPKGLYVLEALASGVPVVQPRHGSFPELIEATGGGLLVNPEDPADLANGLRLLLEDHERRMEHARQGQEAVRQRFNANRMAEQTLAVFGMYVTRG